MNKAFEKILERLEECQERYDDIAFAEMNENGHTIDFEYAHGKKDSMDEAEKIVQEVVEEYNNGWIPCSKGLPEEHDSIFAKFKGTDKWNDMMFKKVSDTVNVTVIDKYSNTVTTHAHTADGNWHCDLLGLSNTYRIIAWQPLPEPYKKEE